MIIVMAILMGACALAYPLFVDIRTHGRDNILNRSANELWEMTGLRSVADRVHGGTVIVRDTIYGTVAVLVIAYVLLQVIRYLFR